VCGGVNGHASFWSSFVKPFFLTIITYDIVVGHLLYLPCMLPRQGNGCGDDCGSLWWCGRIRSRHQHTSCNFLNQLLLTNTLSALSSRERTNFEQQLPSKEVRVLRWVLLAGGLLLHPSAPLRLHPAPSHPFLPYPDPCGFVQKTLPTRTIFAAIFVCSLLCQTHYPVTRHGGGGRGSEGGGVTSSHAQPLCIPPDRLPFVRVLCGL
jgi:hypothetical protein